MIAVPQFMHFGAHLGLFYVVYTARRRSGDMTFIVARMREAANTLGDAVVVVDGGAAGPTPSAALRFGDDGKLYVTLDTGSDARVGLSVESTGRTAELEPAAGLASPAGGRESPTIVGDWASVSCSIGMDAPA